MNAPLSAEAFLARFHQEEGGDLGHPVGGADAAKGGAKGFRGGRPGSGDEAIEPSERHADGREEQGAAYMVRRFGLGKTPRSRPLEIDALRVLMLLPGRGRFH